MTDQEIINGSYLELLFIYRSARGIFLTDRTLEALNAIHEGASQKEVLAGVRAAVDTFVKEAPQFDDMTMLGMKYFGPENKTETEES